MFEWEITQNNPIELLVSKEIREQRVELCKSCDNLNNVQICDLCGCIMPVKTWLKFSECPDKKWMQQ